MFRFLFEAINKRVMFLWMLNWPWGWTRLESDGSYEE